MKILNLLKAFWNASPELILMMILSIVITILVIMYNIKLEKRGKDKNDYAIKNMLAFYSYQLFASILFTRIIHMIIKIKNPSLETNELYNIFLSKVITYPIMFLAISIVIKSIVMVSIRFVDFYTLLITFILSRSKNKFLKGFTIKVLIHKELARTPAKYTLRELEYIVFSRMECMDNGVLYIVYHQYTCLLYTYPNPRDLTR